MPAPLNRQPNGLLDFFGIKNGGENPLELGRILQPHIDVLALYENAAPTEVGTATGVIAAGPVLFGPAGVTTDPGATWHFRNASITVTTTAVGDSCYVELGAVGAGVFVPMAGTLYGNQGLGATGLSGVNTLILRDVWLPPGWALAYRALAFSGAPPFEVAWWAYQYRW